MKVMEFILPRYGRSPREERTQIHTDRGHWMWERVMRKKSKYNEGYAKKVEI